VVLLVDEYDKPILNNLQKTVLGEIKAVISAFYAAVKAQDKYLRFVFITGVSKFAKVSVFSGMNNMTDISMDNAYTTLCGVTQQELEHHFDGAIDDLVTAQNGSDRLNKDELLVKNKYWYNGYRFEEDAPSVYNPYSLLSLFTKKKFKNYWFTTATPTFLLNLLQDKQYDLTDLSQLEIGESAFAATEPEDMDYQSLFYAIFTLLGLSIEAEVRTNKGRIDCVLQTEDVVYIIEFKLKDSKEAALKQIHTKQYEQKYHNCGKSIILLGVEFDQDGRNIGDFVKESL
jgi:hypothetical protein